jgi:hypothetical protein
MGKKDINEEFFTPKKVLGFNDEIKPHFLPELDNVSDSFVQGQNEILDYVDSCLEADENNRIENFVRIASKALEREIVLSSKPNSSAEYQVSLNPKDIRSILMDFFTKMNQSNFNFVQLGKK